MKKQSFTQRISNWAGDRVAQMIWAGRTRKMPARQTTAYAKLMNIGSERFMKDRPLIKPTPANLRRFSRTVYARRAINRVKGAISGLAWKIQPKAGVTLSSEIKRQIEVTTMCFERPNIDDSFRTLIEQVVEDYLICGAGAIEQETGSDMIRPLWMWPVDATSIQLYPGWNGDKNEARYIQSLGYGNVGGVQGIPLRNDQLIYIRKDPNTENPFGYGCVEIAFNSINRQLTTADYAGNVAGNAQPANLLQFVGMDKSNIDSFREFWRIEVEGQGETPIIGGDDAKVHKLHSANDDALYLKYQEFLIREIATAFEISPMNLGIESDVNRNTAEVAEDRDWSAAIIPTASNLSAYLTREAINGALGFSQIELKFEGLDRDDEEMLANIHGEYYQMNALTPNEIREKLGRERSDSEWGDKTAADVEIAKIAAKGVGQNLDQDLPAPTKQKTSGRNVKSK